MRLHEKKKKKKRVDQLGDERTREKEGENLYFQLGDSDSWRRTIEKPFARSSAPAPLFSEVISYIECSVAPSPPPHPSLAGAGETGGRVSYLFAISASNRRRKER
jgi:hypothetical protein